MQIKAGVKFGIVADAMATMQLVVYHAFTRRRVDCVLTSVKDSKHMVGSRHYINRAKDYRTKHYLGDKIALRDEIKAALGSDFLVLLESLGKPNEHLHVEYRGDAQ